MRPVAVHDIKQIEKNNGILDCAMIDEILIQIIGDGDFSMTVYGKLTNDLSDYSQLSIIKMLNFDTLDSITTQGLYMVMTEGITAIKFEYSDNLKDMEVRISEL